MSENGSRNGSGSDPSELRPRSSDEAITHMREVAERAKSEFEEASRSADEAIREADLALRIGSRV